MTERDRLREIIETLPQPQVHALLTLLDCPPPLRDADFAKLLAEAPEEDVDEDTADRILASGSEDGETISHVELRRRLRGEHPDGVLGIF